MAQQHHAAPGSSASTAVASRDLSELVLAVFEQWRCEGIPFLILRNYEGLPQDTTNDIDVLVVPEDLVRAERALVAAAQRTGFVLHNRAEFSPVSIFFHHPGSQQQIQFDLFHCLNWRGFALLSPRTVLAARIDRGLFAIPHPTHEAVLNLITRQIYHGYAYEKYRPRVLAGVKQAPALATASLADMFGEHVAQRMTQAILAERWTDVERQTGAMRRQLIWRRLTRRPLATLASFGRDLRRFAGRLWHPPGITVVLLGADGCGKSTVAVRFIEALKHSFNPGKGLHGHWKPMVFPRRRRAQTGPVTDPHGQPVRGRLASLAMLFCHWLEFLVGGGVQFLPALFRNGMVLMDRYHYDFVVDPRRYRLRVTPGFVRVLFRFLPSPDLVFLLDAPTEVLRARKQEVTEAETRRQQAAFRNLVAELSNAQVVDCAQPPETVVHRVLAETLNYLAARQARRAK